MSESDSDTFTLNKHEASAFNTYYAENASEGDKFKSALKIILCAAIKPWHIFDINKADSYKKAGKIQEFKEGVNTVDFNKEAYDDANSYTYAIIGSLTLLAIGLTFTTGREILQESPFIDLSNRSKIALPLLVYTAYLLGGAGWKHQFSKRDK